MKRSCFDLNSSKDHTMIVNATAKELNITITDDKGNIVLTYSVENYKFNADTQGLVTAFFAIAAHAKTLGSL